MILNKEYISANNDLKDFSMNFLMKFKITMFAYSRVFPDGSRSELWTDIKSLSHTFVEKKYLNNIYTPGIYRDTDKYIYLPEKIKYIQDKKLKNRYIKQISDQVKIFNNDNCFNIIKRNEFVCEYFIFYTESNFIDPVNYYFNNLIHIESFINEFKKNCDYIIDIADVNKIVVPMKIIANKKMEDTKIFTNPFGLTINQIEVCNHIRNGMTAREIGLLKNTSPRTIEKTIELIKNKMDCRRRSEIILKLNELIN